jgi:hypothetical protein
VGREGGKEDERKKRKMRGRKGRKEGRYEREGKERSPYFDGGRKWE